jgi:hypothetical protein
VQQGIFMSDYLRALPGIRDIATNITAYYGSASRAQVGVATSVVAVMMGVDDEAQRSTRELANPCENFPGKRRKLGIYYENSFITYLDSDIACPFNNQHENIIAYLQDFNFNIIEIPLGIKRWGYQDAYAKTKVF